MTHRKLITNLKGEKTMSQVRRELSKIAYERLIDEYLNIYSYKPTNGKFLSSRPWLKLFEEKQSFSIDYTNYENVDFNEKDRDTFLSYVLTDEDVIDEDKIEFLINRPNLLTRKLRAVEKFMFVCKKEKAPKKEKTDDTIFFNNRYAPTITKGPVDDICSVVSRKDNFQKYADIFDLIEENKIKVENYGIDYDMNDVNLSIDVITEKDNLILNSEEELNCFEAQLDKKIEEASKYLSQDTERVLRYLQTLRYRETKNKPIIEGYTAVIEIDVDDILKGFGLRICPKNRVDILNQLNQISNLTLNVKFDKDTPNYRDGKKRNKKDVLYISSKLINFSYAILCTEDVKEGKAQNFINDLSDIDVKTVKKVKVSMSWTDVFERLYSDGAKFLNLNLPQEVYKLPRYKLKNFDLCMYLARLSNSTLSNSRNKRKAIPCLSIRLIKLFEYMNSAHDIESTRKKTESLNSLLDVIEDCFELYIRNEILVDSTITELRENRHLINIYNYKEFKVNIYFNNNKPQLESNIAE